MNDDLLKRCLVQGEELRLADAAPLAAYLRGQLLACKKELGDYAHRFSPRKFTQPQLKVLVDLRHRSWAVATVTEAAVSARNAEGARALRLKLSEIFPDLGRISFRRLIALLRCNPELVHALELRHIPTYSTLAHAERRFEKA